MNRSSGNSRANMDIKETTARLRRTFHYPTDDSSSNGGGTPEVLDEEGKPIPAAHETKSRFYTRSLIYNENPFRTRKPNSDSRRAKCRHKSTISDPPRRSAHPLIHPLYSCALPDLNPFHCSLRTNLPDIHRLFVIQSAHNRDRHTPLGRLGTIRSQGQQRQPPRRGQRRRFHLRSRPQWHGHIEPTTEKTADE